MWNPFKRKPKRQRELEDLAKTFAIMEAFARRGRIHWQYKDSILLVEEELALVNLSYGPEKFQNFLNAAAQWQNFQLIQEAYERHRINHEAEAVRRASTPGRVLTNDDLQRIRLNARASMPEIDLATISTISEFDIMVIRANAPSSAEATEANGQLLALGHYDGEKVEMAMYDDIKDTLQGGKAASSPV